MSLKVTASIAAIFSLAYAVCSSAQFIQVLSRVPAAQYAQYGYLNLVSWPVGIFAQLTLALFLFQLVGRKKNS